MKKKNKQDLIGYVSDNNIIGIHNKYGALIATKFSHSNPKYPNIVNLLNGTPKIAKLVEKNKSVIEALLLAKLVYDENELPIVNQLDGLFLLAGNEKKRLWKLYQYMLIGDSTKEVALFPSYDFQHTYSESINTFLTSIKNVTGKQSLFKKQKENVFTKMNMKGYAVEFYQFIRKGLWEIRQKDQQLKLKGLLMGDNSGLYPFLAELDKLIPETEVTHIKTKRLSGSKLFIKIIEEHTALFALSLSTLENCLKSDCIDFNKQNKRLLRELLKLLKTVFKTFGLQPAQETLDQLLYQFDKIAIDVFPKYYFEQSFNVVLSYMDIVFSEHQLAFAAVKEMWLIDKIDPSAYALVSFPAESIPQDEQGFYESYEENFFASDFEPFLANLALLFFETVDLQQETILTYINEARTHAATIAIKVSESIHVKNLISYGDLSMLLKLEAISIIFTKMNNDVKIFLNNACITKTKDMISLIAPVLLNDMNLLLSDISKEVMLEKAKLLAEKNLIPQQINAEDENIIARHIFKFLIQNKYYKELGIFKEYQHFIIQCCMDIFGTDKPDDKRIQPILNKLTRTIKKRLLAVADLMTAEELNKDNIIKLMKEVVLSYIYMEINKKTLKEEKSTLQNGIAHQTSMECVEISKGKVEISKGNTEVSNNNNLNTETDKKADRTGELSEMSLFSQKESKNTNPASDTTQKLTN